MNKADLVKSVYTKLGKLSDSLTKSTVEHCVNATIEAMGDGICEMKKSKESLQLIGFGTFSVSDRKARTGRNPKTGEEIKIKASKTVKFRVSSNLKTKLN